MLKLRDIMTTEVISVPPDMTMRDAMELLSRRHLSGAPVIDGGRVVGVFSSSDILAVLADLSDTTPSITFRRRSRRTSPLEDVTVDDVMTRQVQSLHPHCTIEEAARMMVDRQIHRILVMEDGVLLGIVSTSDLAKAVADHKIRTRTYVFANH